MDSKTIIIQRLEKKIAVTNKVIKYWVPISMLVGLLLGGLGYQRYKVNGGGWLLAVSIALIIVPVAMLYDNLKNRKDELLLQYARNQPGKIVWIYHHILRVNGVPQESMMVCDDDGRIYKLPITRKRGQEDELMNALVNVFPQAVIGFSQELKKLYERNPQQFRELVAGEQNFL
jgi:hypothetical protein